MIGGSAGGVDPLGLRHVLGGRALPVLVAAMAFLASLALGGALAAHAWADRWERGAGTALTAVVPRPTEEGRLARSLALLKADPVVAAAGVLPPDEVTALLRPWLADADAVPPALLPGVVAVRSADSADSGALAVLGARLAADVPGATLESHVAWAGRLATLLRGLEGCGWGALALVGGAAILVVVVATWAALVAGRGAVDILHGLGATDIYVATRFSRRASASALIGSLAGVVLALPVLLAVASRARPFDLGPPPAGGLQALPALLSLALAAIPFTAGALGWATAQVTVQVWLRRLP